jgi:hypothetical protein
MPTALTFSPDPIIVSVLGPSLTMAIQPKWGFDDNSQAGCGLFTGSWTTTDLLTADLATLTMTAFAPFGTVLQSYSYPYTITR